jgi:hypothetical protein
VLLIPACHNPSLVPLRLCGFVGVLVGACGCVCVGGWVWVCVYVFMPHLEMHPTQAGIALTSMSYPIACPSEARFETQI